MKLRLILFNLALAACIGVSAWQGSLHWKAAEAARRRTMEASAHVPATAPPAPVPLPDAPAAVKYVDVATKDLFSKDRNPTVIIEAPKVEKPREMPPLPVIYGVLGLPSGTKALMAEKPGLATKSVRTGDSVGEFKIAALDSQAVTFLWEGKEIRKQVDDLMDRTGRGGVAPSAPVPGPAPMAPLQAGVPVQQNDPGVPSAPTLGGGVIGADIGSAGHPERACRAGDQSAAGTVIDGFRKVLVSTPFGTNCRWVPVQ